MLLALAIYIDPINSFIYTWRFLLSLEESYAGFCKRAVNVFRITSIWIVPLVSVGLYISLALVEANMLQQGEFIIQKLPDANYDVYLKFLDQTNLLDSVLSYWTTFINLTTCVILTITIFYVNRLA